MKKLILLCSTAVIVTLIIALSYNKRNTTDKYSEAATEISFEMSDSNFMKACCEKMGYNYDSCLQMTAEQRANMCKEMCESYASSCMEASKCNMNHKD